MVAGVPLEHEGLVPLDSSPHLWVMISRRGRGDKRKELLTNAIYRYQPLAGIYEEPSGKLP
jgi:hypothetical protein